MHAEFCRRFEDYLDTEHCFLVSSGSAALWAALEACGIGAGDEVIVPIVTWVATAISVLNVNAVPVFVDVDPSTGCMDPAEVESAITSRTSAVLAVHVHSSVADLDRITSIARSKGLAVIEDCAQAHGSEYGGRRVGTLGDLGTFSMNQEKLLACGEGGAVVTDSSKLYDRVVRVSTDGSYWQEGKPEVGKYELVDGHELMGSNYCASEFQAAVLLHQLERLDELNRQRRKNAAYLDNLLVDLGLRPWESSPGTTRRAYFRYAACRRPEDFQGIPTSLLCAALSAELGFTVEETECRPLHRNSLYNPRSKRRHNISEAYMAAVALKDRRFPKAEKLYDTTLTFHHRLLLANSIDMESVAEAIEKVRMSVDELLTEWEGRDWRQDGYT